MLKHLLATTALLLPVAAFAQSYEGPRYTTPTLDRATVSSGSIEPNVIAPGDTIRVHYRLGFIEQDLPSRPSAQLVGLPENSLAVGTRTVLDVPVAHLAHGASDITVRAPARAGRYPLAIRLQTQSGYTATYPIGTLTILDTPGRIESAQWVPVAGAGVCTGGTMPAAIRYTVSDLNGADDVQRIAIGNVASQPAATMVTPPPSVVVRDAYGNVVTTQSTGTLVAPAPSGPFIPVPNVVQLGRFTVTEVPGAPYVVQTTPGTVVVQPSLPSTVAVPYPLPLGSVALTPPRAGAGITETVVSPVQVPCVGGYPSAWRVEVTAIDVDDVDGSPRQLQTVNVLP